MLIKKRSILLLLFVLLLVNVSALTDDLGNAINFNYPNQAIVINGSMNLTDYCFANGTNNSGVDCQKQLITNPNSFGDIYKINNTGFNIYDNDLLTWFGIINYNSFLSRLNLGNINIGDVYLDGNILNLRAGDTFELSGLQGFISANGVTHSSYDGTKITNFVNQRSNNGANITSNYFIGNGSLLTGVCLNNGTGCTTSSGSSNINGTNVWIGNLSLGYNGTRGILDVKSGDTITVGNPSSASLTFLYGSGGYVDFGNCFDFNVYAYKISGANTVYSSTPANAYGCDDGTGVQSFVINISWSAVSGATGYKIVVTQDDYYGAYGDFYITNTSTSVIDDNGDVYISESPVIVTPTSVLSGADTYINVTTGLLTHNRNSILNGEVNITGQTRIEDILNVYKDYSSYTGANDLGSVLFRNANGTVKIRYDWHDTFGTWMDIRNSVGASSWIGEITYTNPSSTFFDDRLALFQVRTSPSSNGGGQFFLVTHTNTSDNFNYNVQMYENGAVTLGSNGGNDGVYTSPASKIWNRGNVAIGNGASSISAPTNGLYVAGNTIMNGTLNTTRINATYINVGNITVGDIIYSNNWSWYENGDTLELRNATNGLKYSFNNTGNIGNPVSSSGGNASWNETRANALYYSISNPSGYLVYSDTISNADTCSIANDANTAGSANQLNDGTVTFNNDGNGNWQIDAGGFNIPNYINGVGTPVQGTFGYNFSSNTPLYYNGSMWMPFNQSSGSSSSTPNDGITVKVANISDYTSYSKTYLLANTSRTFFNLTNRNWEVNVFNMSLSANTNYSIDCYLMANTTTTTTGVQYNLSASNTINWMNLIASHQTTATSAYTSVYCGGAVKECVMLGATGAVLPLRNEFKGTIETNSNPVYLTLNMRSEIAQNVSTQRGSYCRVEKII